VLHCTASASASARYTTSSVVSLRHNGLCVSLLLRRRTAFQRLIFFLPRNVSLKIMLVPAHGFGVALFCSALFSVFVLASTLRADGDGIMSSATPVLSRCTSSCTCQVIFFILTTLSIQYFPTVSLQAQNISSTNLFHHSRLLVPPGLSSRLTGLDRIIMLIG